MPTITLPNAAGPIAVSTHAVYTRVLWGDAWTLQPDLHCQRITRATGETLSAAEFRYRYGGHLAAGSSVWTVKPVVAINPLSYVRVVVAGTAGRAGFTWCGVWRAVVKNDVDQIFSAVGLEQVLDQPCQDAPWWDGTTLRWAGVGLAFNRDGKPERSAAKHTVHGQSVYVWEPDQSVAQYWSTQTAVETLLAMAAPKDPAGTVLWNWTPQSLTQLPDFDQVALATDGVSFLQLLRSLVTRYRLTGFCVESPASGAALDVRFFTFAETAIDLTDVASAVIGTIPANAGQDTIVHVADQSSRSSIAFEASNVADQVIVIGARRKKVFTLRKDDDAWTRLWSIALQNEYDDGASGAADYPPVDDQDLRDQRDQDARNTERLRPVYSHFGPKPDWDQEIDGHPLGTDSAGAQVLLYRPLLRLAERLPLLSGYEYDGAKIANAQTQPGHHGTKVPEVPNEQLPILVFVRVVRPNVDWAGKDRWQLLDQIGRNAQLESLPSQASRQWSGEARPLRDKLGVEIRVQGEQQHVIALAETGGTDLAIEGSVDWGLSDQEVYATVCVEDPRRVEVRYPEDSAVVAYGELLRRLRIESPQHELIYVVPDTFVGVDAPTLALLQTDGGYLQDDQTEMGLIAQRTYEWHRVPRYALRLSTGWIDGALKIGRLITAVTDPAGTWPVRSVITEITVEFPIAGSDTPPRPALSLATAFGEFDAQRL